MSIDKFSGICENVVYVKRSTVKRIEFKNCDTVYIGSKDSGKYSIECDTLKNSSKMFQYHLLLESERIKLNDPDILITNLIWDYKKDLSWLLFRYKRVEAVSFDVIKCGNQIK
jgi:hypothetical protein